MKTLFLLLIFPIFCNSQTQAVYYPIEYDSSLIKPGVYRIAFSNDIYVVEEYTKDSVRLWEERYLWVQVGRFYDYNSAYRYIIKALLNKPKKERVEYFGPFYLKDAPNKDTLTPKNRINIHLYKNPKDW